MLLNLYSRPRPKP